MSDWNEICRRPADPPPVPAYAVYIAPVDGDEGDPLHTWAEVGSTSGDRGPIYRSEYLGEWAEHLGDWPDADDARALASHDGFGALEFEFEIESSPALAALIYGASLTVAQQDHRPSADQAALDPTPDACWRCDALPATDDFGLCPRCRVSLTRKDLP